MCLSFTIENWYEERLYIEQTYQKKPDLKIVSNALMQIEFCITSFQFLCVIEKNEGAWYQLPLFEWSASPTRQHQPQTQARNSSLDLRWRLCKWIDRYPYYLLTINFTRFYRGSLRRQMRRKFKIQRSTSARRSPCSAWSISTTLLSFLLLTDQFRRRRKALALLSHDMMPGMKLATSALKTGTTSVRELRKPQLKLPLLSSKLKRLLPEATPELLRLKVSTRFQTWSARFTRRNTILKSRLMCSAHGSTSKTQVFAPSTMV